MKAWLSREREREREIMSILLLFPVVKRTVFFKKNSEQPKRYMVWSCQKMYDALHYLLEIYL